MDTRTQIIFYATLGAILLFMLIFFARIIIEGHKDVKESGSDYVYDERQRLARHKGASVGLLVLFGCYLIFSALSDGNVFRFESRSVEFLFVTWIVLTAMMVYYIWNDADIPVKGPWAKDAAEQAALSQNQLKNPANWALIVIGVVMLVFVVWGVCRNSEFWKENLHYVTWGAFFVLVPVNRFLKQGYDKKHRRTDEDEVGA